MGGIFTGNCAACHSGGNNSIATEKKIKKEALVTYGKYSVEAIITQVTKGYGQMPAFGEKLGPDDIEDVANYVYTQADKWPWAAISLISFSNSPFVVQGSTRGRVACHAERCERTQQR